MKHARPIEFDYASFLAMLILFCLTFLLLAWISIMPISDALQVDIMSGDNFSNRIPLLPDTKL